MNIKFCFLLYCVLMSNVFHNTNVFSQSNTIYVVTYHKADIPSGLTDKAVDKEIINLGGKLPGTLQTQISKIPYSTIKFLDKAAWMKIQKMANYDSAEGLINFVKQNAPKEYDNVLIMKIEKEGITEHQINVKAKIVRPNLELSAHQEIQIKIQYLNSPDTLRAKMRQLAQKIVHEITSPIIKSNRILGNPYIWLGTTTATSLVWFIVEEMKVRDNEDDYDNSGSTSDVINARIRTEKNMTRRDIAGGIAIASVAALGVYSLIKAFSSNRATTSYALERDPQRQVALYSIVRHDEVLMNFRITF